MGGVLSKGKAAASTSAQDTDLLPKENTPSLEHEHGARTSATTATDTKQATSDTQTSQTEDPAKAVISHAGSAELPPDMQFILESGLHEEPADEGGSAGRGQQQGSIQDAVNDIKAKYNFNQPIGSGELERIRKEIELKTRLMEMREAQHQRRMAAQASANKGIIPSTQEQQAYKVDLKGKGRANPDDDESSNSENDDVSSSDEDSDSGSSSSSGSSIGLKRPTKNGKQQDNGEESDADDSDVEFGTGKLKPEEIAQAAAAFASQHEVINPNIPPSPVDTIPADAPLRPIGKIDHIINSVIVIRADISTQESMKGQILDEGSLLCLGDRRVLGAIFETFGSVNSPFYSIRLPPGHQLVVKTAVSDGSESEPVQPGMPVFYSPTPDFSGLLFTRDIRQSQLKGSDASNLYDEEVGANEIEFSDDEEEVAYRRDLKQRKKDRWTERQQGAPADNAEFEFDEDFDDTASVRSTVHLPHQPGEDIESEEEGAIVEASGGHKRSLSSSMGNNTQGGETKHPRIEGQAASHRGRGARPERGRGGRGRGSQAGTGQPRGRGAGRGGMDRGRGRGQNRGSSRGTPQNYSNMPHGRPAVSSGLPPRPSYQHPDALPYDDVPPVAFQQQRSMSPIRPQHALPARPHTSVEQYDPSIPHSQSALPPRGMNALAQPWSAQAPSYSLNEHTAYVPSAPFLPSAPGQQHNQPTFAGAFAYNPSYQQQAGQYQQSGFAGMPMGAPTNQYIYPGSGFDVSSRRDNDAAGK